MASVNKEIDLIRSLQKPGLFEKFVAQVYRDFELAGALQYLPDIKTNELESLKSAFLESVLKLEKAHFLKNILYRIDVTELQIQQISKKHPESPFPELITELMIKRILQKVVLKELYSGS